MFRAIASSTRSPFTIPDLLPGVLIPPHGEEREGQPRKGEDTLKKKYIRALFIKKPVEE
jgi:hypothetical protein